MSFFSISIIDENKKTEKEKNDSIINEKNNILSEILLKEKEKNFINNEDIKKDQISLYDESEKEIIINNNNENNQDCLLNLNTNFILLANKLNSISIFDENNKIKKIQSKDFDIRGNKNENDYSKNEMRGHKIYDPPFGWIGHGLRVWDDEDDNNNMWIKNQNLEGEWAVAYYVTNITDVVNVIFNGFKNENPNFLWENIINIYINSKSGINVTGNIKIAEKLAIKKYPYEYLCILMCRVNPEKIKIINEKFNIWLIKDDKKNIKPYRILIKKYTDLNNNICDKNNEENICNDNKDYNKYNKDYTYNRNKYNNFKNNKHKYDKYIKKKINVKTNTNIKNKFKDSNSEKDNSSDNDDIYINEEIQKDLVNRIFIPKTMYKKFFLNTDLNEDLSNNDNKINSLEEKMNKNLLSILNDNIFKEKYKNFIYNIFNEINKKNFKIITNSYNNFSINNNIKNIIKELLFIVNLIIKDNISPHSKNDILIKIIKDNYYVNHNNIYNNYYYISTSIRFNIRSNIKTNKNLLLDTVKLKLKFFISFRSGDTQIIFDKIIFEYEDINKEKIKIDIIKKYNSNEGDLIFHLYNNVLGINGLCYCICNFSYCNYCEEKKNYKNLNKSLFPFDDFILYLNSVNDIYKEKDETYIYYKSKPSYNWNDNGYKCSFCKTFKQNPNYKLWKYIFNNKFDPDHSCYFIICNDCVYNNEKLIEDKKILCPNCEKFFINFYNAEKIINK